MERVCFLARVRPDRLDEYRARREHVWPEMRALMVGAADPFQLFRIMHEAVKAASSIPASPLG